MHETTIRTEVYGAYAARGFARFWIWLARHTPLGRGSFRRKAWKVISGSSPCYDLEVRGLKMRLYPGKNTVDRKMILRPDRVLAEEIEFLTGLFSSATPDKPMTYIDIGANIGGLTLPIAKLPNVRVISVEPDPQSYPRLAFNLNANGFDHVHLEELALSDREGEVDFISDSVDSKYSGIDGRWANGETIRIPSMTLQGLLKKRGFGHVDALKIDVEGHEDPILLPFYETCPRQLWPRCVIIEAIEREGLPDCIERLRALGYRDRFKTRSNLCLELG